MTKPHKRQRICICSERVARSGNRKFCRNHNVSGIHFFYLNKFFAKTAVQLADFFTALLAHIRHFAVRNNRAGNNLEIRESSANSALNSVYSINGICIKTLDLTLSSLSSAACVPYHATCDSDNQPYPISTSASV